VLTLPGRKYASEVLNQTECLPQNTSKAHLPTLLIYQIDFAPSGLILQNMPSSLNSWLSVTVAANTSFHVN
jgi:hypothetical protein